MAMMQRHSRLQMTMRIPSTHHPERIGPARPTLPATSGQREAATATPRDDPSLDRRSTLLGAGSLCLSMALSSFGSPAQAEGASLAIQTYVDAADKFEIVVPKDWALGTGSISGATSFAGSSGARRTVAFFPDDPSAHDVNVSIVISNISVEYTKLGSFGNVYAFSANLVNSLDRSFLLKSRPKDYVPSPDEEPIQIAKLVDCKDAGDRYNVEYTVQKLPGPQRHLLSTVMVGSNGRYNRFYTVTAQCLEEDLPKYRPALEAAIRTFKADMQPFY